MPALQSLRNCYDIAMHFTHGLATADRRELLVANPLPLLPTRSAEATDKYLSDGVPRKLGGLQGESTFRANCQVCHFGGEDTINPAKNLGKSALEKYSMFDESKIVNQVKNGNGAMPGFRGRLQTQQIEDVVAYVLKQAENGW